MNALIQFAFQRCRFAASIAIICVALAGCDDKRRHQTSEELEFTPKPPAAGADAPPEAIGRETLEAMHELQQVRREGLGKSGNREKYEIAMSRLFGLADRAKIYAAMRPSPSTGGGSLFAPTDITEGAAVRQIVESWTSKAAHYIDGIDWDSIKSKTTDKTATVTALAENAQERAALSKIEAELAADKSSPANGTPEYWSAVRAKTLAQGFNVPIVAQIELSLTKGTDGWRVDGVTIGPMP